MNTLFLTIKREYFDQIKAGTKKIEYREKKPYWDERLAKHYDQIIFQAGYSRAAPRLTAQLKRVQIGKIKHPFFGDSETEVYELHLGKILS